MDQHLVLDFFPSLSKDHIEIGVEITDFFLIVTEILLEFWENCASSIER